MVSASGYGHTNHPPIERLDMLLELAYHYYTIIVFKDFTGYINYIHEDSPLLYLAYRIAGL